MRNTLKLFYRLWTNTVEATSNICYVTRIRNSKKYRNERIKTEIQRTVHQIEKGLSIEQPKKGFGLAKIQLLIDYLKELEASDEEAIEVINRASSCIISYFNFYKSHNWEEKKIGDLEQKFYNLNLKYEYDESYGGLLNIAKVVHSESEMEVIRDIAESRHSIRDFTGEIVSMSTIEEAVRFAQLAPSACNRQSVRAYVIDKKDFGKYKDWLGDIGFFGDYGFDKIVLVTAKLTGYNESEGVQHLVSPGIFVGYLVLALEALNVGSCIMQRSLYNDKKWAAAKKIMDIPDDEQSFCLVGCGVKKDKYKVPVSKRLPTSTILKEL
jgi:nitroreductase